MREPALGSCLVLEEKQGLEKPRDKFSVQLVAVLVPVKIGLLF